jgi:hypothetical protein
MSATLTRVCSALVRFNMSLCALTRHEASRACSSLCLHAGARRVRAEGGRPRDLDAPDSRAKKPGGHDVTPRPVCQQATPSPAVRSALREACSPPHARVRAQGFFFVHAYLRPCVVPLSENGRSLSDAASVPAQLSRGRHQAPHPTPPNYVFWLRQNTPPSAATP